MSDNGSGILPDHGDLFDASTINLEGDDGLVEMVIFEHLFPGKKAKQVVQRFREPRLYAIYDAENAVKIAEHMIHCAVQCGVNVQIPIPKREVSAMKRQTLVARTMHIIRDLQERNRRPDYIAQHIVDSILSEID